MGENIYFITINNRKYKFELNDSGLQLCPDEKDEKEEKKSTTKDEEKEIVLPNVIIVTRKNGIPLFALEPNEKDLSGIQVLTAQQLYSKAIQWLEPLAENYRKLIWSNEKTLMPNSNVFDAYKHFTWNQIIQFSLINRWSIDFRSGGSGDWKKVENGANGYLLVTVNGNPYWADAIGQIPFSIDTMRKYIMKYKGDYTQAIKQTINDGMEYGNGSILFKETDKSNTYDNYFILRGCLWSKSKFKCSKTITPKGKEEYKFEINSGNFENILNSEITKHDRDRYAQWSY